MKECIIAIFVVLSVFSATGIDNSMPTQQRALHVSEVIYTLPSSNDPDSGDINKDLIPFHYDAYNCFILIPIVSVEALQEYAENFQSEKKSIQDEMNAPELYRNIHHFGISLEELLEALETPYGRGYEEELLRAMYLPYEEMLAVTMRPQAVYLNGNVYNIKTLNELFQTDKDEFSQFSLDELIDFQERLEENGVLYGFNQDMVDFATQNNPQ